VRSVRVVFAVYLAVIVIGIVYVTALGLMGR
jgi:hypothetical protein